jgi:acetyl esterase/lipase
MTQLPPIPNDFSDHKYAVKHGVPLWLRVYPSSGGSSGSRTGSLTLAEVKSGVSAPWLLWVHGGAYCSGQHYQLRTWLLPLLHPLGVHVVSVAHRFIPQVSMEDMLQDCLDAVAWCKKNLASVLDPRGRCDVERFGLGGDSAGGGLAALLAHRLQAARVLINVYGVTDLVLQQKLYDAQPPAAQQWKGDVSEEEMAEIIADHDPSHAVTATTTLWTLASLTPSTISQGPGAVARGLKDVWKVSDEEWMYNDRVKHQWDVKSYVGHQKLMVTLPLRLTPDMTASEREEKMKAYSPNYLLATNPTQVYPPTAFLHGTADNAVPIDESKNMAFELRKKGVEVEELYCEGVDHGWDNIYTVNRDAGSWLT